MGLLADHAALTDIGLQRTTNEDSFVDTPPLFAVADGMGGAQAGEVASRTAVEALRRALDAGRSLPEAAQEANLQVFTLAERDPSRSGMGTTLTVLRLLQGNERAELAHVGDSRAYLLRGGRLEQVTADHSLVGEMVREGKLTPAEAFDHPARSILSRALGTEPGVKIDRGELDLRAGDSVLVCSDGLSSAVPDATIAQLLEGGSARDAARRLVREAKNRGGHDNITVVVLRFSDEAPARGDEERTAVLPESSAVDTTATAPLPATPASVEDGMTAPLPATGPPAEQVRGEERATEQAGGGEEAAREAAVAAGGAVRETLVAGGATASPEAAGELAAASSAAATSAAAAAEAAAPLQGRRRLLGRGLWLLIAALAIAALVVAGAVALNVSYYVGVDSGYVSVFQGLPYSPAGLDLSRVYLRTQTPVNAVAPEDQHLLTAHAVTSKDEAVRTVEALRTATPTPTPVPSPSPSAGRSSTRPSAKGTP